MILISDILTSEQVTKLVEDKGVEGLLVQNARNCIAVESCEEKMRRDGRRVLDVKLSGNGSCGHGYNARNYTPAGWDEWGFILGCLYVIDPAMEVRIGSKVVYEDSHEFNDITFNRFAGGTMPTDAHKRHKWMRNYGSDYQSCTACSAQQQTYRY